MDSNQKIIKLVIFWDQSKYFSIIIIEIFSRYVEILSKGKPKFIWNSETKECEVNTVVANTRYNLYFPCLRFLKERLTLFEDANVGAFVWDGGQGLQYFYELF